MKIKELVYMVLDEIKGLSDDFTYTEDHVIFLLNKYRTSLLKQKYKDDKSAMHSSNFQTMLLTLKDSLQNKDYILERQYKQSEEVIPELLTDKGVRVYPETQFLDNADIAFITEDRMRYVGYNKYLKNAVYATIHNDYLYLTSRNLDIMDLEQVHLSAVFEDAIETIGTIVNVENEDVQEEENVNKPEDVDKLDDVEESDDVDKPDDMNNLDNEDKPDDTGKSEDVNNPQDMEQPKEEKPSDALAGTSQKEYIVEKGDTLASISKKIYGNVSHVDSICNANGLEDGNLIFIGQKLLLP